MRPFGQATARIEYKRGGGMNPSAGRDAKANRQSMDLSKYLTFQLDGQEYGISILKIKEINGLIEVTSVPRTPDFVKGVINLRGKVIPVIDLRLKFGMEEIEPTDRTCIIVVELPSEDGTFQMGLIVDSVSEVLNINQTDIEDAPAFDQSVDVNFIMGMAKIDGGVKILLDMENVLTNAEFSMIAQTGASDKTDSIN